MARTLLEIVQDACREVGQPRPSVVTSATSDTPLRMMSLLNTAGRNLAIEHDWTALTDVETFTPLAQESQTGHPPADFLKFSSEAAMWDINNQRPLIGPLALDKWMRLVVDAQQSIDKYWTVIGGTIRILPAPAVTDSFTYSYQSKNWVISAASALKASFTADDDQPRLDDELLVLELIWRWKQSIGVDYAEDMSNAGRRKETVIAADRGNRIINLSRPQLGGIPENYWPGVISP